VSHCTPQLEKRFGFQSKREGGGGGDDARREERRKRMTRGKTHEAEMVCKEP